MENFTKTQKSAKMRIFLGMDKKIANLTHVKISLQPKFQGSSLKNKQDIGSVENVFKIWKISRKLENLPKGEFFGALIIKQQV